MIANECRIGQDYICVSNKKSAFIFRELIERSKEKNSTIVCECAVVNGNLIMSTPCLNDNYNTEDDKGPNTSRAA